MAESRSRSDWTPRLALLTLLSLLSALGFAVQAPFRAPAGAWQEATPAAASAPLHVLATAEGTLPAPDHDLVWLVQQGALFGEQRAEREPFQLGFVLGRRGTLALLDASGTPLMELAPGQAAPLPRNTGETFASATGDVALYVQIALVPSADLPPGPPPQGSVGAAFRAATDGPSSIALLRGFLNPDRAATVPAAAAPTLLLALDSPIRVKETGGAETMLQRDESALLDGAATIRNDSPYPASFVAARVAAEPVPSGAAATPQAASQAAQPLDPVIDDAWRRSGCHLNPGNAACATVAVAAACAFDPADAACTADGDGDGCSNVAEIRAAFDPFDPADCIGGGQGDPAVNCLFPNEDLACDGGRIAEAESACAAARDIRLRRSPTSLYGCDLGATPPADACTIEARDPLCDGFAPGQG